MTVYSSRPEGDRRVRYLRCTICRQPLGSYSVAEPQPVPQQRAQVNPFAPTDAKPGSEDKVELLAARYEAGLPLWNDQDRLEHGPSDDDPPPPLQLEDEDDGCEFD